jgi:hypothetical protein
MERLKSLKMPENTSENEWRLMRESRRLCKELLSLYHMTHWGDDQELHDSVRQTLIDAGCTEDVI